MSTGSIARPSVEYARCTLCVELCRLRRYGPVLVSSISLSVLVSGAALVFFCRSWCYTTFRIVADNAPALCVGNTISICRPARHNWHCSHVICLEIFAPAEHMRSLGAKFARTARMPLSCFATISLYNLSAVRTSSRFRALPICCRRIKARCRSTAPSVDTRAVLYPMLCAVGCSSICSMLARQ